MKKIPLDTLFGNPKRVAPMISPDGKYISFIAPYEGVLNLWFYAVDSDINSAQLLTQVKNRPILSYFWVGDSQHLVYRQDSDGDENWHLYLVDLQTKTTKDITPFESAQVNVVATSPNFPQEILVSLNKRNPQLHDVYRLHLISGALDLVAENPGDVAGWLADPEMNIRASMSMNPQTGEIEVRTRQNIEESWSSFLIWSAEDSFSSVVAFSPDGENLYLSDSRDHDTLRLVEVSLKDKSTRVLAENPNYDLGDVLIHPTTNHLQAVQFVEERNKWGILDPLIQDDFIKAQAGIKGDFFILSRNHEDTLWLTGFTTDLGPVRYYLYDRQKRENRFLFSNRPELEDYTLAPMKPISFQARDGLKIEGYITLPVGVDPKNAPLVLNVHGGPWHRDCWGYHPEAQWLASNGYVCLQVNFRGSTGYGKNFVNAANREWSGKMHDDLLDALAWAKNAGYYDGERQAIYGGSYGGYAALVGATFTPEVFTCAISVVGPSNLITLIQSVPAYWKPMRALFDKRIGHLETEEEFLKSCSPLFKVDQIQIPVLIVQGKNDPRVKQAESEQIVNAMRKAGKSVEYLLYEDEGHGFVRPENRLNFYGKAEEFLERWLKQAPVSSVS